MLLLFKGTNKNIWHIKELGSVYSSAVRDLAVPKSHVLHIEFVTSLFKQLAYSDI